MPLDGWMDGRMDDGQVKIRKSRREGKASEMVKRDRIQKISKC